MRHLNICVYFIVWTSKMESTMQTVADLSISDTAHDAYWGRTNQSMLAIN